MKNPMESKPVFPLLMSMAVPPMVSMLIQSMYNIVDSIFVARLGEEALTAVSLAYPLQNLVLAVAVGLGVGGKCRHCKKFGSQKSRPGRPHCCSYNFLYGDSCDYFYTGWNFFDEAVLADVYTE